MSGLLGNPRLIGVEDLYAAVIVNPVSRRLLRPSP